MSTDPIYYLMDRFHDFKADTQVAIKSAVNQVADSEAVRKISENEGVRSLGSRVAGVFDGATNVISKFDMRKPFDLKGAASQSSSSVRLWDRITDWITKHKLLTAVLVATVSGSTFYYVYKVNMGFHGAESMITAALNALALSFSRELESQKIPFIHIKMGSFNLSHGNNQHERQIQQAIKSDIASWPDHLIDIYAQQYESSSALQTRGKHAGSPLRTLNYTIFDALTARHPSRVYYAGRGAFTYSMLPAILPESLLTWILRPAAGERSSEWDGEFV
ncbi:hypothetical protein DV451_004555 [Geotrichum candidum]|uniref:Uncharacterized protein n=1 Tax=Geotrichum candidum TaxID=1173061 RepID=A0A9P5G1U5_GEOCN|nr:hypothetical protein DV451_004555 [Geotrichum candidum]KAF5110433.1 hypothetical protein DV453_000793 [Geotrichum candidum]